MRMTRIVYDVGCAYHYEWLHMRVHSSMNTTGRSEAERVENVGYRQRLSVV